MKLREELASCLCRMTEEFSTTAAQNARKTPNWEERPSIQSGASGLKAPRNRIVLTGFTQNLKYKPALVF